MSLEQTEKFINTPNVASLLDDEELETIGRICYRELQIDEDSRQEWLEKNKEGMKLAKQVTESKTFPWPDSANVKYPLITVSSINFASRAYPEIIQGQNIVKARVIGDDPQGLKADRADRVSAHMSYQITEEMPEWEEQMDRLLHVLPILGCCFKKTYFDSVQKVNTSDLVLPEDLIVNVKAKSTDAARRLSHRIWKFKNYIYEQQTSGLWLDVDLKLPEDREGDSDAPEEFYEQHRYYDLDGDGYAEPYAITFHKETKKVVRISPRYGMEDVILNAKGTKVVKIDPKQFFTKFSFIPDPEGGFYDLGFGALLGPINRSVNTVLNQLLDAGTLSNAGGGFVGRGARIKGGIIELKLGEWQFVDTKGDDLRKSLVPYPIKDPSQVLYLLLGTLIEAGNSISSVTNVMKGEKPGENVSVETILALAEQGLKVFSAIFKRIYRGSKSEYQKLFRLNSVYLKEDEYIRVLDNPLAIKRVDYNVADLDVSPVAEPGMSLDVLRLAKARALREGMGMPGLKPMQVTKRWLEATKQENIEEIFDENQQPQPDPATVEAMARLDMDKAKMSLEMEEIKAQIAKIVAEIAKIQADTALSGAKAGSESLKPVIESEKLRVEEKKVAKDDRTE